MTEDKGTYLSFTPDTTTDAARQVYIACYGVEPERVFVMYPTKLVCCGPIPQPEPLTA
jgi:hypothetical protein